MDGTSIASVDSLFAVGRSRDWLLERNCWHPRFAFSGGPNQSLGRSVPWSNPLVSPLVKHSTTYSNQSFCCFPTSAPIGVESSAGTLAVDPMYSFLLLGRHTSAYVILCIRTKPLPVLTPIEFVVAENTGYIGTPLY